MKLFEYVNEKELREMMDAGYINMQMHPSAPLYIYNYSKTCQFEKMWNDTTEKCRGLIVDSNDNIVARPFPKFYNYEEYEDPSVIPDLPFDVFEKLDGSLGILYWINDIPYIATRGSFISDQALHATNLLHSKYRHGWDRLDRDKTYLFEIIYPDDLHVITYKDVDNIFLLAVIDIDTGVEETPYNYKGVFSVAEHYSCRDWREIRNLINGDNREGFVVRFSNGFRIKLKYQEYMKLHFLKAGFTENKIFEYISKDETDYIDKVMDMFDEEHRLYYQKIIDGFYNEFNSIIKICKKEYRDNFETQKEAALYFNTCTYPAVLFAMRKSKDIRSIVWKIVDKMKKYSTKN